MFLHFQPNTPPFPLVCPVLPYEHSPAPRSALWQTKTLLLGHFSSDLDKTSKMSPISPRLPYFAPIGPFEDSGTVMFWSAHFEDIPAVSGVPKAGTKSERATPHKEADGRQLTISWRRASIGQVWTRHLAPAAPASRPSLPTQFHDCSCHADSALQFVPSLLPGWGKSRAASTGFRALSPLD